jgi:hypothetical protein
MIVFTYCLYVYIWLYTIYVYMYIYIFNICIYMYYLLHTKYSVCCHVWKHHVGEASFPIGVAVNPGMPRPSNFSVVNSFIFAG